MRIRENENVPRLETEGRLAAFAYETDHHLCRMRRVKRKLKLKIQSKMTIRSTEI